MTKAQLQDRVHKLNSCVTFSLGLLEAIAEEAKDVRVRVLCDESAKIIRGHAGDAWVDGEKA